MKDIVIPKNNEAEFIELALKLSIKKLYFLYDFDYYDQEKVKKKLDSIKSRMEIEIGFIANQKNLNKSFHQSKLLVVRSSDKDRFFIESKKIKIIYGFEGVNREDYIHQRASGLNHVLCEMAAKNNVAVGFPYISLFNKTPEESSLIIGRMMQNIKLCQKYKVKIVIGSFSSKPFDLRAPHDIRALFAMLGMGQEDIKDEFLIT